MARRLSSADKARARVAKRQQQSGFHGDGGVWIDLASLAATDYETTGSSSDYTHYSGGGYDSSSSSSDCGGGGGGE